MKRVLSIGLVLVLALSSFLAVPVHANERPGNRMFEVSINASVASLGLTQTEYLLRTWDVEYGDWLKDENDWSYRTESWTKGDATTFNIGQGYKLPLGTCIKIRLLDQEGCDADSVNIRAWTDTDRDGVYDQWIFLYRDDGYSDTNRALIQEEKLEHTTNEPFYYEDNPYTGIWGNAIWASGSELSWGSADYIADDVYLSAGYLTKVFGTNTLLSVSVWQDAEIWENYFFYLTGEIIDTNDLEVEEPISVTQGGALTSPWAYESVSAAERNNLIPNWQYGLNMTNSINRGDFASVALSLYKALGGEVVTNADHPFTDVWWNGVRNRNIKEAYLAGIVNGVTETTFGPNEQVSREQAVVVLAKIYSNLYEAIPDASTTNFADNDSISSWAKSAVSFMAEKGWIKGVGGNKFAPAQGMSWQEALTLAEKMLEGLM